MLVRSMTLLGALWDALAVAHMERRGITEILSYDQHFDRIEGLVRSEP